MVLVFFFAKVLASAAFGMQVINWNDPTFDWFLHFQTNKDLFFCQISSSSGSCSMAFSAFRKTLWLLFGHNDKKGLASAHSVTGLSDYTSFKSSQDCDVGGSKYLRIYWLLKPTAQFGTLFLLNGIPRKLSFPTQGSFLPHIYTTHTQLQEHLSFRPLKPQHGSPFPQSFTTSPGPHCLKLDKQHILRNSTARQKVARCLAQKCGEN